MNRRGFFGRLASLTGAAVLLPKALPPEEAPPFPPDKNPVENPQLDHFYDALPYYSFGTTSVSMLEADLWPSQTMVRWRPAVILCDYCGSRRLADHTTCPGCGAR